MNKCDGLQCQMKRMVMSLETDSPTNYCEILDGTGICSTGPDIFITVTGRPIQPKLQRVPYSKPGDWKQNVKSL